MKDINRLRRITYLRTKARYYELLYRREIAFDCLDKNFERAKIFSQSYFTDNGHDMENLAIYDGEIESLRYSLMNLREYKRLNIEIRDVKEKLLRAEKKLK